jgi:hypothetical protein
VDIDYVALLVASLVSSIIFVFVKVPFPEVVPVVRFAILAFAHPLLIPLVFRTVLLCALVKTAHGGQGVHAPFLADLAMRGFAISFVIRASVALSDSFPGFLMFPMLTFQL